MRSLQPVTYEQLLGDERHILIVDDDDSVLLLLKRVLEKAGYAVKTAVDGLNALQQIDSDPPALLITDIMMPELSGLELARGLKGHPQTKQLPVIFLTASEDPMHLTQGLSLGARQYLTKPFSQDKLLSKVEQLLKEE